MKAYGPAPGDFRIGLAPIDHACWFEGSSGDPSPRKDRLLAEAPQDVWGETAASRAGQVEALGMMCDWLRAPPPAGDGPPLWRASRLVEDDLCLMEKQGSEWTLTAASLASASFFTPADTVGKALHQLHDPVPGFNDRFLGRVARIFDHLAAEQILERRNWSIVNSGDLSLPRMAPVRSAIPGIRVEEAGRALFIRSERQTIRRLPQTGGVLFTIRIWREAVGDVVNNPVRREAFEAAWRAAMNDPAGSVRAYKGFALYAPLIEALLG